MFRFLTLVLATVLYSGYFVAAEDKVVCYYDGRASFRAGDGKVDVADIDQALGLCGYLVYGYAGIDADTNKLVSLNETNDLDSGVVRAFRTVTTLKKKYQNMKILLSVGGGADRNDATYLTVLESAGNRLAFINSAYTMVKTYDFDGLDLAWQLPTTKPKKHRSTIGSFFHKIKETVGLSNGVVDENAEAHRDGFAALVSELKDAFQKEKYHVTVTMLPNVNATIYMDVPKIIENVHFVTLAAFDFATPARNPKEADYPSPIKALNERNPNNNLEGEVGYWLTTNPSTEKIIVGIPAFGRAWKLTKDSGLTGVPPLETDGPAEAGPQTKVAGLLSWPEVCTKINNPGTQKPLTRTSDPTKRYGTYAYQTVDDSGESGIWIGYEEPETAALKVKYLREKKLGGFGLFDLSLDDVKGTCGDKFAILRAAKYQLDKKDNN